MRLPYALLALAPLAPVRFGNAQTADVWKSNPKYISTMAEGKLLTALRRQMSSGRFKDAAATAASVVSIATDAKEKSIGESDRGYAFYSQAGDKGKAGWLNAADGSFTAAIADYPKNATAHFFEGKILARQGQTVAASTEFKTCISCLSPKDPSYVRAQHFAANPSLSLAKMAPLHRHCT